jgi:hypothetical protein
VPEPAITDRRFTVLMILVIGGVWVLGIVFYLILRPNAPHHPGTPAGPNSGPTDLITVYPTPDFTLPPIPPVTKEPVHGTWRFVATQANLYTGMTQSEAISDVNRLAVDSDVIGMNEVSRERAGQLRTWAAEHPGWSFYSPTGSDPYQGLNAVLVNTKVFTVVDEGVLYGSRSSMRGYKISSRWVTWLLLRHKASKTNVSWVQTHMDAAVESHGHPRAKAGQRIRNNLAYMQVLKATVAKLATVGQVLVAGDWNVDAAADRQVEYGAFPYAVLEGDGSNSALPGLRSIYTALGIKGPPTRSGRWIDYIASWVRPAAENIMTFVDYRILTGGNSDHNPVEAVVQIKK